MTIGVSGGYFLTRSWISLVLSSRMAPSALWPESCHCPRVRVSTSRTCSPPASRVLTSATVILGGWVALSGAASAGGGARDGGRGPRRGFADGAPSSGRAGGGAGGRLDGDAAGARRAAFAKRLTPLAYLCIPWRHPFRLGDLRSCAMGWRAYCPPESGPRNEPRRQ